MSDRIDPTANTLDFGANGASDGPPSETLSAIFGCAGPVLGPDEARFFAETKPFGFILFVRNVVDADQLRRLVEDLRASVGWRAPVLIDQEGGRVARLRAPLWRAWPPVAEITDRADAGGLDEAAAREALSLRYQLIGRELGALGIDVNCVPLLDVRQASGHQIIGDRALGFDPERVAGRGRAVAEGLIAGGATPVIKHLPGHGRATLDSHLELPRVETSAAELAEMDLPPFRALADLPFGMTAHVVYAALDPEQCATLSETVIRDTIRGAIGFDGALMTDDLSMKALSGGFRARAEQALAAGCDLVLHCNGDAAEMAATAAGCGALDGAALARCRRASAARAAPAPFDEAAALDRLAALGAAPSAAA